MQSLTSRFGRREHKGSLTKAEQVKTPLKVIHQLPPPALFESKIISAIYQGRGAPTPVRLEYIQGGRPAPQILLKTACSVPKFLPE